MAGMILTCAAAENLVKNGDPQEILKQGNTLVLMGHGSAVAEAREALVASKKFAASVLLDQFYACCQADDVSGMTEVFRYLCQASLQVGLVRLLGDVKTRNIFFGYCRLAIALAASAKIVIKVRVAA